MWLHISVTFFLIVHAFWAAFADNEYITTIAPVHGLWALTDDSSGNIYVGNNGGDGAVMKVHAGSNTASSYGSSFSCPTGVWMSSTNTLYVSDVCTDKIYTVSTSRAVAHFSGTASCGFFGDGGIAKSATLCSPWGLHGDSTGTVYIADSGNHRIRSVSLATKIIRTVAGGGTSTSAVSGPATSAALSNPISVFVTSTGSLFICETGRNRIRKVRGGKIYTVAGGGSSTADGAVATSAKLNNPQYVVVDPLTGNLLIADTRNHKVRVVLASTEKIFTIAGTGSAGNGTDNILANSSALNSPVGLLLTKERRILIADRNNDRVRMLTKKIDITESTSQSTCREPIVQPMHPAKAILQAVCLTLVLFVVGCIVWMVCVSSKSFGIEYTQSIMKQIQELKAKLEAETAKTDIANSTLTEVVEENLLLTEQKMELDEEAKKLRQEVSRCRKESENLEFNWHLTLNGLVEENQQLSDNLSILTKQKNDIEKEARDLQQQVSQYRKDNEIMEAHRLCVVCQSKEKSVLLMPCRHMILCDECVNDVGLRACPVCRKPIGDRMYIYL